MSSCSIVLPAYNEAESLEQQIRDIYSGMNSREELFEIIIVEDGCTDDTPEIAERLSKEIEAVGHIHSDKRLGKGKAIRKGFGNSKHENLIFVDADSSIKFRQIEKIIDSLENGSKAVIGSRYGAESSTDQKIFRNLTSTAYNLAARTILSTQVQDHQCGLKGFKRETWELIEPKIRDDSWFMDTELIYFCRRNNIDIEEVGIEWKSGGSSSVNPFIDGPVMFEKLLELRLGQYFDPKLLRFLIVGGLGALLNTSILFALTHVTSLYYIASAFLATETAIITMFFLNNQFTFRSTKTGSKIISGILKSNIVRSVGIATSLSVLYILTEYTPVPLLVGNLIGIVLGSIVNFFGEREFNWSESSSLHRTGTD